MERGRTGQGLRAYGHTIAEATILHIFNVPEIFVSFWGSICFAHLSCDFGWASMIEPLSSQSYFSTEPSKVIKCSCLIFGKFIIETRNKVTLYEVIVVREGEVKHIQLIFLNHCLQKERKSNIKSPALNLLDYCGYTSCFNNV